MQRGSSTTDLASLLHQNSPSRPQPQRSMSYHEQQSGLSALLPPLNMGTLDMHDRTELPRPYKCPLCDKAFHRLEHQTRHIRTHTGEKPHACSFPGCTKRFSRSDELTRHSRIHTNPNSRRSTKNQQAAALAAAAQAAQMDQGMNRMMPPPPKIISKSAPPSQLGSPNVSPPHSYGAMNYQATTLAPFGRTSSSPALSGGGGPGGLDLNSLAQTATQQLERENRPYSFGAHPYGPRFTQLPPLSSAAMARNHSHEEEDPYIQHRNAKKSRPSSPISTAPSSPTFSHGSCSPTPESTPLATPAHSPRIHPRDLDYSMQLPGIRALSLRQLPALAPMEVADPWHANANSGAPTPSQPANGLRLGDIINRPDGAQRKLPVPPLPRVAVHDLLNGGGPVLMGSTSSSAANSIAGGDLADRI